MKVFALVVALAAVLLAVNGQMNPPHRNPHQNPHFARGHVGIVHLMEWKWVDIARECERFLGPRGFGGVQVSPVNENVIMARRPWYERYQSISFGLTTRSGNEAQFRNMVRRCNRVGVRIYVDVIFNHMTGIHRVNQGTGGSVADPANQLYPAVPLNRSHFNYDRYPCGIDDWDHPVQVRNCQLLGLRDLNQAVPHVRNVILQFLNRLVEIGVAGFRVDAAKHMWPQDLRAIYSSIRRLNTQHGFPPNSQVYIAQEVIELHMSGPPPRIHKRLYTPLAPITEFIFSSELGRAFRRHYSLNNLRGWGTWPSFVHTRDALVFVDNHDNQRDRGHLHVLTYHTPKQYKMATAWALAHPYGNVRMMSSFRFDRNTEFSRGPPQDAQGNLLSPIIRPDGTCDDRWICEHRWRQITNMVSFRNVSGNTPMSHWWSNGVNQIAICRGDRAFAVWNNEQSNDLNQRLRVCVPAGEYCDIISGQRQGNRCTGTRITVGQDNHAQIQLRANAFDGVIAIHVGPLSRLS